MPRLLVIIGFAVVLLAGCVIHKQPSAGETWYENSYITGYTFWDNNPPGSAEICCPVKHSVAAGNSTYADPITVAVDYTQLEGGTAMQFLPGTIFYIPNLRAYFIVEDRTGEIQQENTAQHGGSNPHLDVWADGRTSSASSADDCVQSFTDTGLLVIKDPQPNYLVVQGALAHDGKCRKNYGNTVIEP